MKYVVIFLCLAFVLIPKFAFCDATEDSLKAITDTIPQNWWDGGWDKVSQLQNFISNNADKPVLCAQAQYYIGCYYYSIADYDNAIRAYDTVVSSYPSADSERAKAEYEIGQIYLNCKDKPAEAISEYQKVLTYNDANLNPMSQIMIGRAYLKLEDYANAEAAFRKVLSDYPKATRQDYDAYMELGNLRIQQANNTDKAKIREALTYYKKAYQICPLDEPKRLQYTISM